jgi:hypothetical protein
MKELAQERSDELSSSGKRMWVGIDADKGHHWAVAVDADGQTLF